MIFGFYLTLASRSEAMAFRESSSSSVRLNWYFVASRPNLNESSSIQYSPLSHALQLLGGELLCKIDLILCSDSCL